MRCCEVIEGGGGFGGKRGRWRYEPPYSARTTGPDRCKPLRGHVLVGGLPSTARGGCGDYVKSSAAAERESPHCGGVLGVKYNHNKR
jgi:hypothetical protein